MSNFQGLLPLECLQSFKKRRLKRTGFTKWYKSLQNIPFMQHWRKVQLSNCGRNFLEG